jgi:hypothetical protein
VLLASVGAKVGRRPTAATDAGANAAMAGDVRRWSRGGTRSGTSEEHSRRSCHSLPLLGLLVGADCIVRDDNIADKLWKYPSRVERHALLQLGGETDHEAIILLLVHVHLVPCILRQLVE